MASDVTLKRKKFVDAVCDRLTEYDFEIVSYPYASAEYEPTIAPLEGCFCLIFTNKKGTCLPWMLDLEGIQESWVDKVVSTVKRKLGG